LGNIMTLDHRIHTNFDNLHLWLEGDDVSPIRTYRFILISHFPAATEYVPRLYHVSGDKGRRPRRRRV